MYKTVITGASSGIGRATALLLAKEGHSLILSARREKALQELAELCTAEGAKAVTVVAGDVTDSETNKMLSESAMEMQGELVLINSAGFADVGQFHETDIDRAVEMVDVMLTGTMRATHALIPSMLQAGGGTVINILSIFSTVDFPGAAAYCAAKAGAHMFSKVLSKEYRLHGVRVTAILPGSTDTAIWDGMAEHPPREDMLPVSAIAETVRDVINAPRDRSIDEIVVTPPKGIL